MNIWYTYINLTIRNTPIFIHVHFHDCGRKGSLLSEKNWKEEQIQCLQCMSLFCDEYSEPCVFKIKVHYFECGYCILGGGWTKCLNFFTPNLGLHDAGEQKNMFKMDSKQQNINN